MNPDQPGIPPPGNSYDFIVNPQKQVRARGGLLQNPLFVKLLFIIGGALVLMLLAMVVVNVFFGDKVNYDDMIRLAKTQTEIARVADLGDKIGSQTIRNAAANTSLTLNNQRNEWLDFLAKANHGIDPKQLRASRNKATDTKLNNAKKTSTYDQTYVEIMTQYLDDYLKDLKASHSRAFGKKEKALFAKHYAQTEFLRKQWP